MEKPMAMILQGDIISDNAIRKWCKQYNLPYKATIIRKYTEEEWLNI